MSADRYPILELQRFTGALFAAAGVPAADAEVMGQLLVRTQARGVETHGVQWAPRYCRALQAGKINPAPRVRVESRPGAALLVDGDGGLGHVASTRAMELCIELAGEYGVGMAAVRNSRHNGAASLYALQAMEAGMLGLSLTGGGVRVAPAGGTEALLGTNPIAFAAPTLEEPPFVMDMATSVVAGARVTAHAQKGLPLPPGWALGPEGRPTTDAEAAERGVLLPLGSTLDGGSYKGFALGLLVETLCGVLTGMATGPERARGIAEGASGTGLGHFFAAIRIDRFQPPDEFRRHLNRTLRLLRESRAAEGVERIYTPGELEWRREQACAAEGVPLDAATVEALNAAAGDFAVPVLESVT